MYRPIEEMKTAITTEAISKATAEATKSETTAEVKSVARVKSIAVRVVTTKVTTVAREAKATEVIARGQIIAAVMQAVWICP